MEILISFLVFGYSLGEMGKDTHQFQIVGRAMEESINKEGVLINVESDKKYIQIKVPHVVTTWRIYYEYTRSTINVWRGFDTILEN